MIGLLSGTLVARAPERVILDVGGVGYEVHIPLSTYYEIERAGEGAVVRLFIHTHVREDALALYGFATEREKVLFERLLAVSGIGPRLAQVILSGMPPADLLAALAAGDVPRLVSIPGVGKKTAERMVVELRDKMRDLVTAGGAAAPSPAPAGDDLVMALVNLGYKEAQAQRAVAQARHESPAAPFADLLRTSLRRLARL